MIFQIRDCEIWFVRFSTDLEEKTLALGNTKGKIYTWDLTVLVYISSTLNSFDVASGF